MKRDDKKETGARQAEGAEPTASRKVLERLKRAKAYAAPILLSISGPVAAATPEVPENGPPIPIIPTLGEVGVGLLVGGLAAAGGMMVYRKRKGKQQGPGDDPDDSSKK